jgi:hypothetical protein
MLPARIAFMHRSLSVVIPYQLSFVDLVKLAGFPFGRLTPIAAFKAEHFTWTKRCRLTPSAEPVLS